MLAEIYGQALEKAEFRVARKKAYDTPDALYAAMEAGDVQLTGSTTQALFTWVQAQSGKTDPCRRRPRCRPTRSPRPAGNAEVRGRRRLRKTKT